MTKSKETSRKREPKTSDTTVGGLFGRLDPVLVVSASLALIAIGLWAVASSSTAFSVKHYGDPHYVFYKQLVGLCIGSAAACSVPHANRFLVSSCWMVLSSFS